MSANVPHKAKLAIQFAQGATESTPVSIRDARAAVLYTPAEFNTDTITFKGAISTDQTHYLIRSGGSDVSITGATDKMHELADEVLVPGSLVVVTNTPTAAAATMWLHIQS